MSLVIQQCIELKDGKVMRVVDINQQDVDKMPKGAEPSIASTRSALDHGVPDPDEDDLDDLDGKSSNLNVSSLERKLR